ncbi:MAG: 50S ribosomal protein L24 [Proteobacteria bacterium]|nr:50S ribosomal protein L24 [Desulfobulbaceae bacterium]MBU4154437.1 50S ribosomal protein L24 [Pseudomonadota bacterium]
MNYTHQVKKDDQVEVLSGKDKGRVGKILRVDPKNNTAIVEKVNVVKRHTKPNPANQQGGIISKEAMIDLSNLKLICPKCAKTVRLGKKILDDGSKVRVCKKCGESVEAK